MQILLAPAGSHGDVHPFVGIGQALRQRGHQITLITAEPFRPLADAHDFEFVPTASEQDYHDLTHNPDLWHPRKSLDVLFDREHFPRILRSSYQAIADRYMPGETVLLGGSLALSARLAHEKLNVPLATVHLQPMALPSVVDPAVYPTLRMRPWWPYWYRRLLIWVGERLLMDGKLAPVVNRYRAELGLPKIKRIWGDWRHSPQRIFCLFPEWYARAEDWPEVCRNVGFVRYDQSDHQQLPAELDQFLNDGPPPVAFTFGTAMRTGQTYFAAATEACQSMGLRGLLLVRGKHQVPERLPNTVLHADYAPFSRVFPRCQAVVHHGGIGTTAQCLTAGVRQLVMPMAFDQCDNAVRLERLGVSRTLYPKKFQADNLANELKELLADESAVKRADELSARCQGEDSLAEICRQVEELAGSESGR